MIDYNEKVTVELSRADLIDVMFCLNRAAAYLDREAEATSSETARKNDAEKAVRYRDLEGRLGASYAKRKL